VYSGWFSKIDADRKYSRALRHYFAAKIEADLTRHLTGTLLSVEADLTTAYGAFRPSPWIVPNGGLPILNRPPQFGMQTGLASIIDLSGWKLRLADKSTV
jgi:hypothetical protein